MIRTTLRDMATACGALAVSALLVAAAVLPAQGAVAATIGL